MDYPTFIENFPEFADTGKFPLSAFNFYFDLAQKSIDPTYWVDRADYAQALFTAHHLVLESRAMRVASVGGLPGLTQGVVVGKGVGGVSEALDVSTVVLEGAGHWNITDYGIRFQLLCRLVGAGGIQLI